MVIMNGRPPGWPDKKGSVATTASGGVTDSERDEGRRWGERKEEREKGRREEKKKPPGRKSLSPRRAECAERDGSVVRCGLEGRERD